MLDVDVAAGHRPGTASYRLVLLALFTAGLATFSLMYSTQAVLPELARSFRVSAAQSIWSVSLTTLGLAAALLVAGPLSERVGRTRLIHGSLWASGTAAAACAAAPTWSSLLALRLIEGIALAGLPAVATAYLREELHESALARAAGLYIGGNALGGMVGRLLTGAVADLAGWRWALAVNAALGLGCALAVLLLLPRSTRFTAATGGVRGLVRAGRRAVCDRGLLALYGIGGCGSGVIVSLFNALGFRLTAAPFHLSLAAASLVFAVYPFGVVSAAAFGRLADARGRHRVLPLGLLLCGLGIGLTLSSRLPVVVAGVALVTAGFFGVHGVASGWVPSRAHATGASTGQAASLYLFSYYVGSTAFGTASGAAWAWRGWSGVAALAATLLAVTVALTALLRGARTPAPAGTA